MSGVDINALKQERAGLAKQARDLLTEAQEGKRDLSPDDERKFDALMKDADGIEARIQREEKARELERKIADGAPNDPPPGAPKNADEARTRAFRSYVLGGRQNLTPDEARALNASSDPEGGYLVAPQQWVNQLIQAIDDAVPLRGLATTMTLSDGESLGVPSLDTDLGDAEWTSELGTGSQDDGLRLGKREFRPNPVAKRVKISRTLLRKASRDPETLVRERLDYKFGVTQEKGFMTGDGNKKPLGLFAASTDGISTGRDVSIGASGALSLDALTGDELIDAKHTLKAAYWNRARWLFHRDILRVVRKLKDANNQYLWQPGLQGDRPDTILEVPYVMSEFAPNTVAADNYVGMIGDFSHYWIVDALDMEIQRLVELYAETNQVGFIGRMETDGMPVLEEAFVRLQVRSGTR
ncbi:phage major capsid protein [Amycolatopsis palatopharyngis]|uniref:phage major capsid protein n=1 Tax=Amycolatopsis palatopharyngis TaxID=187982 RepID=UPI000E2572E7|nr:phage major capsid protein [Amycolatopsis palatopharyngis]